MSKKISFFTLIFAPLLSFGQMQIDSFDSAPADSNYWGYEISENADSTLSYVNVSYITDQVAEGTGAMQLEYSGHNSESWGGYAKIEHYVRQPLPPDTTGGGDGPGLVGTWKLAPIAGAFKVGPNPDDGSWWGNSEADITGRGCLFDDEYIFNADGSFQNVLGADTWNETWQEGVDADGCGAPVAPHDGSASATYAHDATANTLTLTGAGAFLGIAKAITGAELSDDPAPAVPDSRTYTVHPTDDGTLKLSIPTSSGFWTFTFEKQAPVFDLAGTWKLAPIAGAFKVGPNPDDGSWWGNSEADITGRGCLFDDEYIFNADGSFQNVLGADTWNETWQEGVDADGCGAPVAPHDGSASATYAHDATANTLTLTGAGAFLGIAKAITGAELSDDPAPAVPDSRTYTVHPTDDGTLKLSIPTSSGFWTFTFEKQASTGQLLVNEGDTFNPNAVFRVTPEEGDLWDWSAYDSISFKYYNSIPASEANRIHLRLNISDYAGVDADYRGLGEYYYSFHYILDSEPRFAI